MSSLLCRFNFLYIKDPIKDDEIHINNKISPVIINNEMCHLQKHGGLEYAK